MFIVRAAMNDNCVKCFKLFRVEFAERFFDKCLQIEFCIIDCFHNYLLSNSDKSIFSFLVYSINLAIIYIKNIYLHNLTTCSCAQVVFGYSMDDVRAAASSSGTLFPADIGFTENSNENSFSDMQSSGFSAGPQEFEPIPA